MYRNCVYDTKAGEVHLFTWDADGNRVKYDIPFKPYLYVEDIDGKYTSIFNTKLKKKVFDNSYERNKFIKYSGIRRTFELLPPVQQFLVDEYWRQNNNEDFVKHSLRIWFLDIETYSPDAFPDVQDPQDPVNIISFYDTLDKKIYSYGTSRYTGNNKDVEYVYCVDEAELFNKFLDHMSRDHPDVLSGWNSEFFDIPYIRNRGEYVVGSDILAMSPLNRIRSKTFIDRMGKDRIKYIIEGVSGIDYLDIYKKFTLVNRESYKLDAIGEVELGRNKLDYGDISLSELADTDWNKFVDYNIQDVQLLVDLEDKLKYIELLRMLSVTGLTTLESALGTLLVVTGALCCQARQRGEIISTIDRGWVAGQNPGAYVAEPKRGFNDYVVSFDANSLYPNIMITLNASPETKVGKITIIGDRVSVKYVSGKVEVIHKKNFVRWLREKNYTLSKAGVLFTQDKKGIVPEFVDNYYQERVKVKAKLKEVSKLMYDMRDASVNKTKLDKLKDLKHRLNIKQHTLKILINSTYGYMGNKRAALGDDDIASSVTLTGQAVIKQSNKIITSFYKKNVSEDITADDVVVYNDTDSVYITLKRLLENERFIIGGDINPLVYKLSNSIEDFLNDEINTWGNVSLNSKDCRFVFKREVICSVGLFIQKKRYVLHVLDDEGIKVDKFKYKGVEVVRTTMPNSIKPYARQIIETMLRTKSLEDTTKVVNETYNKFCTLPEEEIAFVMGVNNYEKYAAECNGFTVVKKMPHNVKSAYYYNLVLKLLNLDKKYESISSGDKVRYVYTNKNNKFGIDRVGFKYEYPKEFRDVFEVDKNKMFEKIMFNSIERFYKSVNWTIRKPWEAVQFELFDLFS